MDVIIFDVLVYFFVGFFQKKKNRLCDFLRKSQMSLRNYYTPCWYLPHLYLSLHSPLLLKCSHKAHCAPGPIHESLRDRAWGDKELPTQRRGPCAIHWPLKDVCGMRPETLASPTQTQAPPFQTWPFAKLTRLPQQPQKDVRLLIADARDAQASDVRSGCLSAVASSKPLKGFSRVKCWPTALGLKHKSQTVERNPLAD